MKVLSGAIEAGVTDPDTIIKRISSCGVGSLPWPVQFRDVGATANVTASIAHSSTGAPAAGSDAWELMLDVTGEDGSVMCDITGYNWYVKIEVVSGTTDANFSANVG